MAEHDNGGPAFPGERYSESGWKVGVGQGMTLRDYVACAALPEAIKDYDRKTRKPMDMMEWVLPWACKGAGTREEIIARQAYRYADAMLAERNRADAQNEGFDHG